MELFSIRIQRTFQLVSTALKKAGSTIRIPRRRFLGTSPEVEKAVREIVEENLTEYFTIEYNIIRK